ncbi:hypothetical protein HDU87_005774 [Geranomyces variabilis]|uniref:Uncharacterized protein n=1 Tax=Geranomyces variabilis TaxID=109894 RepID=A0AAD5TGC4_9FUNG|nr:hypothetical protein HDU87_005774 [Geranomyces variabilis]
MLKAAEALSSSEEDEDGLGSTSGPSWQADAVKDLRAWFGDEVEIGKINIHVLMAKIHQKITDTPELQKNIGNPRFPFEYMYVKVLGLDGTAHTESVDV